MSPENVTVIDYGVGNILSVQRGLEHCGAEVRLSSDPSEILSSSKVVLPGVGAFEDGMNALRKLGLVEPLRNLAERDVPILGICLGMQLLLGTSEEFGSTEGLGLIAGNVVGIPNVTTDGTSQKIPHIGWGSLVPARPNCWGETILRNSQEGESVYFVHSFMALPDEPLHRIADCFYGGYRIAAVIRKGNITGCQFHPEKSGPVGLKILRSFIEI